ncbi:MAG TPA: [protein-PII] uridylyltransferase [Aeromicrobium sp.]|nr:[protein-PII] uridylyltransferase [Aeromicrobium sp.]
MNNEQLAQRRRDHALDMDRLLRQLFVDAVPAHLVGGLALVAVGGYGRTEMSPFSDIDVVLLHDREIKADAVGEIAEQLWYPIWDQGLDLDHSVRDVEQMRAMAADDYRAAFGMLDARPVAGDGAMVLGLRSQVLTDWRKSARSRLGQVRDDRLSRIERSGWMAHTSIPDLKESGGGLRDGVIMRALVATWLVDVPHAESEALRRSLLDVRDALHTVAGKRGDKLTHDVIPEVATALGMGAEELDLHVRSIGRRSAHLNALVWRRFDQSRSGSTWRKRTGAGPRLDRVSPGVAILENDVVLTNDADCAADPELPLRAAELAARRGLALSTRSAARMAQTMAVPGDPWPATARRLLVNLLASGPGLVPVWDELDYAGVIDRWLPEWAEIRLRGSSSPVHRFTVDRHSIETCVQVSLRMRHVLRPDLLVVAALLHDIGKGLPGDHSDLGALLAQKVAARWGFDAADAAKISQLVQWHLLLSTTATRRDIEDPMTAANVAEVVGDGDTLDLLAALTESDARATSGTAWSTWRAGLINGLIAKTHDYFDADTVNPDPQSYEGWPESAAGAGDVSAAGPLDPGARGFGLTVLPHVGGSLIRVTMPDRRGGMADVAAGVALAGLEVLSARALSKDGVATSLWEVTRDSVDPKTLGDRLRSVLDGNVDVGARLRLFASTDSIATTVLVLSDRSSTASAIEVRTHDRRGLVWAVCRTIADAGCEIRSAHLSTYGPEARDVFYVVGPGGGPVAPDILEGLKDSVAGVLR